MTSELNGTIQRIKMLHLRITILSSVGIGALIGSMSALNSESVSSDAKVVFMGLLLMMSVVTFILVLTSFLKLNIIINTLEDEF